MCSDKTGIPMVKGGGGVQYLDILWEGPLDSCCVPARYNPDHREGEKNRD
jgi:hypothetical protein